MYTINKSLSSKQHLYTFCNFTYQNRFTTNENVHIQNHIHVLHKIAGQTIYLYNLDQNITKEASIMMKSMCLIFCLYVDLITTTWTINVTVTCHSTLLKRNMIKLRLLLPLICLNWGYYLWQCWKHSYVKQHWSGYVKQQEIHVCHIWLQYYRPQISSV